MKKASFKLNKIIGTTKKVDEVLVRGTTGIDPLDDCIKTTLNDGYIHHIPRLMVSAIS